MKHSNRRTSHRATAVAVLACLCPWAQADTDWGGALLFDGVDDYARIADTLALPLGNSAYTQEFWLRLDAPQPSYGGYGGFVLSRGAEGFVQGNHMVVINGNAGLTHWGVDRDTGVPLAVGEWHHVAATWDGSQESLYLDGVLSWQASAPTLNVAGGSFTLGAHDNGYGYFLKGALDEVRIWNVARSAAEIQANYAQTVAAGSPGLVGYWQFNEADGQTLLDNSAYAQNLTLGGSDQVGSDDPLRVLSTIPAVPEPASWATLAAGGLALSVWVAGRRRAARRLAGG